MSTSSASIVPSHRRSTAPNEENAYLLPSEGWLVAQITLLLSISAWDCGGVTPTALNWILGLTLLGIPILAMRFQETRILNLRPFAPLLLWSIFIGIGLLNPSHTTTPVGWVPLSHWFRWLPTTVDRSHTLEDASLWIPALFEGGLIVTVLRSRKAAKLIWTGIALNGFALATVGALFHFSGSEQVLGFIDPPETTYFFATFFYKNHWAAYGALAAIGSLSVALRSAAPAFAGDVPNRGRFFLFGIVGLLTAVTLPLPGSRAGALLALIIVTGFLAAIFGTWRRTKLQVNAKWRALGLVMAVIAFGIIGFGINAYAPTGRQDVARTTRELRQGIDGEKGDLRLKVSRDTWHMAKQRPVFGWGPGCFEIIFPLFQGNYLRQANGQTLARFEFAHNDWLQLLAEDGCVGLFLLATPLFLISRRSWRHTDAAGRFAIAGCGLIAAHAFIDFPLHNPAVLLLWVVMLGSTYALSPRPN